MKKEYDFSRGVQRAADPNRGKIRVWLYIDDDILKWLRAQIQKAKRGSYDAAINGALRDFIDSEELRQMLREELAPRKVKKKRK
jgi:uncharacterized protein (DUF4415 family)